MKITKVQCFQTPHTPTFGAMTVMNLGGVWRTKICQGGLCGELRSVCDGFEGKWHEINVSDENHENSVFSDPPYPYNTHCH